MRSGRPVRKGPVRWLAPSVILRTLLPVYFSGLFARFSDRREVLGVIRQRVVYTAPETPEISKHGLWVDYVADTGDGFDATATVASLLAPPTLEVGEHVTHAGELLVLGGDEVYPVASMQEYEDRFIGPYQAVLPKADPGRTMVALPGNHDWYDGLTAFLQVFCSGQWVGGWKTVQRRSYFACQLPNRWWLWAIDMQFDTYIDQPQVAYFRSMAHKVQEGDAIILCWAKPSWLEADPAESAEDQEQSGPDMPKQRKGYETLDWFERTIVPEHAKVRLSLTGDAHHYVHYASKDGQHKITAGLGGAFLSATHHLAETLTKRTWANGVKGSTKFTRVAVYPDTAESRKIRPRVLRRIHRNCGFALIPALAYVGLSWWSRPAVVGVTAAAVLGGLLGFTKPQKLAQWWPGLLHGAVQVGFGLATATMVRSVTSSPWLHAGAGALVGAAIGPLLVGLYLLADDERFTLNTNELFAAQAIEDYKGFLRLHFRPDGDLDIYPIKVETVRDWVEEAPSLDTSGHWRLRPKSKPVVSLIEPRIRVRRAP